MWRRACDGFNIFQDLKLFERLDLYDLNRKGLLLEKLSIRCGVEGLDQFPQPGSAVYPERLSALLRLGSSARGEKERRDPGTMIDVKV